MSSKWQVWAAAVCACAWFGSTAWAALIIDRFSYSAASLYAQNWWAGGPGPYDELLETGLPPEETINGQRLTWVQCGLDADPSIAQYQAGWMRFSIDNDECTGGMKYLGLGGVNLTASALDRLALDIDYLGNNSGPGQFVSTYITLRDTIGQAVTNAYALGAWVSGSGFHGVDGTHAFPLLDWGTGVNLAQIADIEVRFWGGSGWHAWFAVDNIVAIPEPGALALLTVLALARRRS